MESASVGCGSATCHWLPTICGAGEATFTQPPSVRFVRDCRVKPADASGYESTLFVPASPTITGGLLALNNWPEPNAAVAAISAEERATL